MLDLLGQTFVKRKRPSFRASVIRHLSQCYKASHAGDVHDVTMIIFDHTRQELLHSPEMGQSVDLNSQADLFFRFIQDGSPEPNTGVIDQDCWMTMIPSYLCSYLFNCGRGCKIYFVEKDVRCYTVC